MVTPENFDGLPHRPVLYKEIISALKPFPGGRYVDATLGAGGHAWGILHASSPDGCLLGLDVDPRAIELAEKRLEAYGDRVLICKASYTTLKQQISGLGWENVNGILIDLGVSSMQLDTPEKGFSFKQTSPLDMRYDPSNPLKASDLVNTLSEKELADILYKYGEERDSRKIARQIVQRRPIYTSDELVDIILSAKNLSRRKQRYKGRSRMKLHPATLTFQALRIAVNRELESLETFLPQAIDVLAPRGRLAVISYHSLEDRIVKLFFKDESRDCICPPGQPVCTCRHKARLVIITPKPVRPSEEEVRQNPRSRSARLRIAERLPD